MTVPPGDVELLTERHDAVDVAETAGSGDIRGRSPWSIAWRRLRRDRLALAGGVIVVLLVLLAIFARPLEHLLGLDPNQTHNGVDSLIDPSTQMPIGKFGGISSAHWLGVEPGSGLGR